ncbi:MAG: hypothetical protein N3B12_09120 [Armatimonadetes bacterium]|nr:hypothetical protein [Armatimonadota bacterium]
MVRFSRGCLFQAACWFLYGRLIATLLCAFLISSVCLVAEARETHFAPDVLVLVLSGIGPFDQVAINYTSEIPKTEALKDIEALVRETSWLVRDTRVTVARASTPGAKPTTSLLFRTPPLASSRDGTLPLEPFISVLRRFPRIEVSYLVYSPFEFRGLKELENKWVKIVLKLGSNSYSYRVTVKNRDFKRLALPLIQPKPMREAAVGNSRQAKLAIVLGLASASALIAYLVAARLYYRRARVQRGRP